LKDPVPGVCYIRELVSSILIIVAPSNLPTHHEHTVTRAAAISFIKYIEETDTSYNSFVVRHRLYFIVFSSTGNYNYPFISVHLAQYNQNTVFYVDVDIPKKSGESFSFKCQTNT